MEIIYKRGDLLQTDIPVIAHGCNAKGVMGSGVAKAVREKWPHVYDEYKFWHSQEMLKPGQVLWVDTDDHKLIANCITQEDYGRSKTKVYVDYIALAKCMKAIEEEGVRRLDEHDPFTFHFVAMPRIGAGLANGDWDRISKIIETCFKQIQPVVYEL